MKRDLLLWTGSKMLSHKKGYCEMIKKKIPIRDNLLEPITETLGRTNYGGNKQWSIRRTKNTVLDSLEGEQSHGIFECFVNEEMKEMIIEKTNWCENALNTEQKTLCFNSFSAA